MIHFLYSLFNTFLFLIPVYVANSVPLLIKGKTPIDCGKNFIDGKRILGDGKTVEGFVFGTLAGFLIGLIILKDPFLSFILSFGALLGDSIESFIKRRIGIKRGDPLPIFDQLDFIFGVFILLYFFYPNLFWQHFLNAIILTVILHPVANFIAYLFKIKDVPW